MEIHKDNQLIHDEEYIYCTLNSAMSISEICEEDYFRSEFKVKTSQKNLTMIDSQNSQIPLTSKKEFRKDDFEFIGSIGRGAYAKVVKAKLIKDNSIYAIKVINKPFIIKVALTCLK
jgi:hypothetical protein